MTEIKIPGYGFWYVWESIEDGISPEQVVATFNHPWDDYLKTIQCDIRYELVHDTATHSSHCEDRFYKVTYHLFFYHASDAVYFKLRFSDDFPRYHSGVFERLDLEAQ